VTGEKCLVKVIYGLYEYNILIDNIMYSMHKVEKGISGKEIIDLD